MIFGVEATVGVETGVAGIEVVGVPAEAETDAVFTGLNLPPEITSSCPSEKTWVWAAFETVTEPDTTVRSAFLMPES